MLLVAESARRFAGDEGVDHQPVDVPGTVVQQRRHVSERLGVDVDQQIDGQMTHRGHHGVLPEKNGTIVSLVSS